MTAVELLLLPHAVGAPRYASDGAAGADLSAAIDADAPVTLSPGARAKVPTGVAIALPAGFEAQVRARSGLALRAGLAVLNAPGTIDADYRGEIAVILINLGDAAVEIRRGDRIAQLVVAPVVQAAFRPVGALSPTARGDGGFGSTGGAPKETDRT